MNGPGEMADADFGYVGGAPGKIDLYVGKVRDAKILGLIPAGRSDEAQLISCLHGRVVIRSTERVIEKVQRRRKQGL